MLPNYARISNGEAVLNADIRDQLLYDVARLRQEGQTFNAILVSGDVAFSGKPIEYADAQEFLNNACNEAGISPSEVWMVPGNHDVDRSLIRHGTRIWQTQIKNPQVLDRQGMLDEIVHLDDRERRELLLGSLENYNNFASHYGCETQLSPLLYWESPMSVTLDEDIILKVRGLNSAFLCNEADQQGPTVMVGTQQSLLGEEPNVVWLVMCHHPENWLADGNTLVQTLRRRGHVALFGHEHRADVKNLDGLLVLHAGAVNPEGAEHATASYNVLSLWVDDTRHLCVDVQRRVYSREHLRFVTHFFPTDAKHYSHRRQLPRPPVTNPANRVKAALKTGGEPTPVTPPEINEETVTRRLTFFLFELSAPDTSPKMAS